MMRPLIGIGADIHPPTKEVREHGFMFLTYSNAVLAAGGIPLLIPPQGENAEDLLERLDGLLLVGGEDCDPALYGEEPHESLKLMDARRQKNDLELARAARAKQVPTLGICLGMQMMCVAAGGSLIQDIDSDRETPIRHSSPPSDRLRHDIEIPGGSKLASILPQGRVGVNSSHHQAVRSAGELVSTARADDGIIEALEDPRHPFYLGVQWHPEDLTGEAGGDPLFLALMAAARGRAERRVGQAVGAAE